MPPIFSCRSPRCIGLSFALVFGLLLNALQVSAHGVKYHEFKPIDRRQGMDASVVYCVTQDTQGLIWMGTNQGLYSFDGYTARNHLASALTGQDEMGVVYCASLVDSIHIWLGTENGLLIFNTFTDRFEPSPGGLPENIRAISRINDHTFWLGSMNGLYRYDVTTQIAAKISDTLLPDQTVYSILRFDENNYYFGTYNGLYRYNVTTGLFEHVTLGNGHWSPNQLILSLLADYQRNCVWVGVEGGLFAYTPSTHQSVEVSIFKGNSIKSLLIDNQNCLWAGTDNGLFIYEPTTQQSRLIRHDALNDRSLVNNIVWTVFADKEQNIWLGTDGGISLFQYNNRYKVQSISELTGSSEGNQIISLLADSKGNLWLGGTNGLIKHDKQMGTTVWYQQNSNTHPLPHNKVRFIFEDMDGDVWIATDGSICRYDDNTAQFVRYQIEDETHTRNANWAYAICQDETRKLWVATCLGGVFVVDKHRLLTSNGRSIVADRNYFTNGGVNALSGSMLQCLSPDADHNMWVGTYRAGINKIDRLNQQVIQFTDQLVVNRLPSNDVTAMLVASDGYLWIALRNRVLRMHARDHSMQEISDSRLTDSYISALADDGKRIWLSSSVGLFVIDKTSLKLKQITAGNNYYSSVHYDGRAHKVIAGGINEYVVFDPEQILSGDEQNHLFITSLWVNDKLVQSGTSPQQPIELSQSIRFTRNIELPYHYNNLAFAFSGFSFNQGQNVQYAYKLEGVDDDWRFTLGDDNRISYNNLRPGDYTLLLSRIGSDGIPMTQPLSLLIKVTPPWYSTLWAKLFYSVLIVMLILAFMNYFMMLNRLRYERLEKIKTMELTAHKIDFLTNISHELKTPLSLIIGPLGLIIEQVKPPALREQLADVRQNALKMGSLIHQLMEAGRQETDGFGLMVSKTDVVELLRSVVAVFERSLVLRNVSVTVQTNVPSLYIEADVLKLESVLSNILSNAAKFAPDGSVVTVKLEATANQVIISVADEGPGIDANDLPQIFNRFFQSRRLLSQNREGSGVGLSIVKEYVQLHRGTVKVLSDGKKGTCVEVKLPIQHITNDSGQGSLVAMPDDHTSSDKPLLLIVEDNQEILSFIANSLSHQFRCITALNGKLGFEAALANHPDAIVTDIMMPVMDGMEMCRKLKENIATSLTPIVMLTAKDDRTTELSGYRTGADAFIAKPFEIGYLSDRLHQLLKGRKLLVNKARQEAIIQPKAMDAPSADEKFLASITQIIEEEIMHADLNVNVLSEKSGYSAKQVYRRIKSLTGQTAVDYIRSVRLKKAASLLSRKTFTVAEVMYMVGFSNHSYFAKRFQAMYGKSPKQYMEE